MDKGQEEAGRFIRYLRDRLETESDQIKREAIENLLRQLGNKEVNVVYEKHGEEIALYQLTAGRDRGRLLFATAILTDVEQMLGGAFPKRHTATPPENLREELEEVKELIADVIKDLGT